MNTMKRTKKERDIIKVLRQMADMAPGAGVFERIWYKIEERAASRANAGRHIVWRPWGHPVRWVAAACLCLALTGTLYHAVSADDNQALAEYLLSISNPTAGVEHDLGVLKLPVLLTDPSTSASNLLKDADDEHSNVLAGDEILL